MGNIYKDTARLDEALASFRRALTLKPADPSINSNLLYSMYFHHKSDAAAIAKEHDRWNDEIAARLGNTLGAVPNDPNPSRKLRIGYVSPDFFHQSESFFVLPLLQAHDHAQFEIHCYSSVRQPDDRTVQIKACADVWHEVLHLSDQQLAEQIRADKIDVLIDLTMHMSNNRMLVFARKPAPVQIAWLAYPGTTGLRAMDYRITDQFMDPEGSDQSWSAEQPIRLPDSWCVYSSLETESVVAPLPAERNGYLTFGSMNNFCKTNDQVLQLWATLLSEVPRSRLILSAPAGSTRQNVREVFAAQGVAVERLQFLDDLSRQDYLRMYDQIDIALDPFPYNGITTTCDAMWKGVPVLSLVGILPASRAGLSLLANVGLQEFAVESIDAFVHKDLECAKDISRLINIRASLRDRMKRSSLTNAPQGNRMCA